MVRDMREQRQVSLQKSRTDQESKNMLNYLPANDKKYDRNENGLYDRNEKILTDRINVLRSQTLPETFKAIRGEK